jgi:uncharacterized protein with PQ loop repeat
MISIAWIGTAGIVAIEGSYFPQIVRLFRLKRADEISVFFPGLNLAGRLLALTYSILVHDQVFVLGFLFGALLRLTLLTQVAWYRYVASRAKAGGVPRLVGELAR